jgi:hypothetical protein
MKHTKISSPLAKENCISKYHDISIKIYKKLIDIGLGEDIPFERLLLNIQIDEETFICITYCNHFGITICYTKTNF